MTDRELDQRCVNAIRFLAVDMVQKANSGHPGLPLDAAPMAYTLWTRFLKYNPRDPHWYDRDRFVLSAGHGSALLYALLHLAGYDVSLDQIKRFRQWDSITPGHPECTLTPGVETTTGPLGQGCGNSVGMAIAEAHLAARFNRPGFPIVDHMTYAIVSDGDVMEGVSAEAASLAGHLKLGKLVWLYDNNHVSLAGGTDITFTEDRGRRFEAYGWHVQSVEDGNDLDGIERSIQSARAETERPSFISIRTHIGYGSPHKQDTFEAHGSPLGEDEVRLTKEHLGWPVEPLFYVPDAVRERFGDLGTKGESAQHEWNDRMAAYAKTFPDLAEEFHRMMQGDLPNGWDAELPAFSVDDQPLATRVASGHTIKAVAPRLGSLAGGSADLDPSTHTALPNLGDFQSPDEQVVDKQGSVGGGWSYAGRNLHFGVREHAMGAILNGMAAHRGMLPFGATFLIFSDYMRPAIRLAALMKLHVIYVFTHDSIGLGEDGPTHQPVEQLLGLRSIPNMVVIRPADANETVAAWQVAVEHQGGPVALVLTRQKLPVLEPNEHRDIPLGVRAGGYILAHAPQGSRPGISLVATGSEVHLALAARERLSKEGIVAQVVSLPCWNLFHGQPAEYRERVLPPDVPILAIEAGVSLGWRSYVGPQIPVVAVDQFGASAPGEIVMDRYGFNAENICRQVRTLLASS
jgi:transketolase